MRRVRGVVMGIRMDMGMGMGIMDIMGIISIISIGVIMGVARIVIRC